MQFVRTRDSGGVCTPALPSHARRGILYQKQLDRRIYSDHSLKSSVNSRIFETDGQQNPRRSRTGHLCGFRGSAHAMEGPPGTKVLKDFGGRHVVLLTTFVGFHLTIIYEVGERINVSFSVVFL